MSKKLAIKGHSTRGKEVINLLEMLGGINWIGSVGDTVNAAHYYNISESKAISIDYIGSDEIDKYATFTLEKFLEKYPFKVGDRVLIPEYESEVRICKMRWDPLCEYMEYMVYRNEDQEWYTAEELLNYNDNPLYLFNEHDIVVVESYDKKQKWICEYKSYDNNQLYFYKGTYDIYSNKEKLIYESFYDVDPSDTIRVASPGEITRLERMIERHNKTNHMPNVLVELFEHIKNTLKEELEKEFNEFEEWSNVDPTVEEFMDFCNKVNKKPKYPTTYEECFNEHTTQNTLSLLANKTDVLYNLLICRNVYWKIAGEEMGLDKPWESTYGCGEWGYWIGYDINANKIYCQDSRILLNHLLVFPTEEMRDTFYENFKDLIEACKELL